VTNAPIDNREKSADRDESGRFKAGASGGPGRPRGVRNKITELLERVLAADGVAVARALVEQAKSGDVQACRAVLDRLLPIARSRPVVLNLPQVESASDVLRAQAVLVQAMAAGEITVDEAAAAGAVLETTRKALETVELEARLAEVERRLAGGGS
jgi:hypothetical protein